MGDFGLAEDVYASGYFRQNDRANAKVPYKWMALESLNDAIFTDVVSQVRGGPIYSSISLMLHFCDITSCMCVFNSS